MLWLWTLWLKYEEHNSAYYFIINRRATFELDEPTFPQATDTGVHGDGNIASPHTGECVQLAYILITCIFQKTDFFKYSVLYCWGFFLVD